MSDSSTPFGTIAVGQTDQVAAANSLFDALSVSSIYAIDNFASAGMSLSLFGGKILINGVLTVITSSPLTLTASTTNYIQALPTTGVAVVHTAYTAGYWQIGRAVTDAFGITAWYDDRFNGWMRPSGLLTKTLPSDANYSLTAAEDANDILVISGTLTATRNIYISLPPRQRTVHNNTGQSLQFIGASGTGVTVATTKRAIIYSDGTNVVRVTADT